MQTKDYNITSFDNIGVNYWGIPKCGNTTIKHILFRGNDLEKFNSYNSPNRKTDKWVHGKCTYITPTKAQQNGYKNFTVLRHPQDRVISMFNSLPRLGENMSGSKNFQQSIKQLFKDKTLENFLLILEKYPDQERNLHFRSQTSWCLNNDIIKLNLTTITTTISQIHPKLIVDIALNQTNNQPTVNENIITKTKKIFKSDFKMWDEIQ